MITKHYKINIYSYLETNRVIMSAMTKVLRCQRCRECGEVLISNPPGYAFIHELEDYTYFLCSKCYDGRTCICRYYKERIDGDNIRVEIINIEKISTVHRGSRKRKYRKN